MNVYDTNVPDFPKLEVSVGNSDLKNYALVPKAWFSVPDTVKMKIAKRLLTIPFDKTWHKKVKCIPYEFDLTSFSISLYKPIGIPLPST